jgi:hypothetical protein
MDVEPVETSFFFALLEGIFFLRLRQWNVFGASFFFIIFLVPTLLFVPFEAVIKRIRCRVRLKQSSNKITFFFV